MTMEPGELLRRISTTLKADIGPEVGNEFAKTQTFMASVVLEKLSKELTLKADHAGSQQADMEDLLLVLDPILAEVDGPTATALTRVRSDLSVAALGPLIEALYARPDDERDAALALIRPVLRRDVDRRMEIAG